VLEFTPARVVHRRKRLDPVPHFKTSIARQMDTMRGCPDAMLEKEHPARTVEKMVGMLDLSTVLAKRSSLGRRGFDPRCILAVWVYASWCGVHHSTKVAKLLKTDQAYRYLSGGHTMSAGMLRRFRRENGDVFEAAIQQTVDLAAKAELLPLKELAIDSVRLRAHAGMGQVRTLSRSTKRLEELAASPVEQMTPEEHATHLQKVEKHRAAVERCEQEGTTNHVLTNPSAALMKFPTGASAPGHRVTVTAAGAELRLVVSLLIDAAGNDFGKLGPAVLQARAALTKAGVPADAPLRICADGGYTSETDLHFALEQAATTEILLAAGPLRGHRNTNGEKFFTRDDFKIAADGVAICPAGRKMKGPFSDGQHRLRYNGIQCDECPLLDKCTDKKVRSLTVRPRLDEARAAMLKAMEDPAAVHNYKRRCCTVEPVFSGLQDQMGFRRISTRLERAARAEIMLKVLAYNLSRLSKNERLCRVFLIFTL
jgi:transposase